MRFALAINCLLFLTLLVRNDAFSQNSIERLGNNIDSLNEQLWLLKQNDPTQVLEESHNTLRLSRSKDYKKGEMLALKNITVVHVIIGNYDSAEFYVGGFLRLAHELKDSVQIANAYNTLGSIYYHKGNLESGLRNFLVALKIIEAQNDVSRIAKIYNNIGNIYMLQKNFDKSLEYNSRSLEIKQQLNDSIGMGHSFNNIGFLKRETQEPEEALEFYNRALDIFTKHQNKLMMANVYANIGETHLATNDLKLALKTFFKVIDLSYQHAGKRERIYGYLGTGKVYAAKSDFKAALPYLEYGNKLALEINAKQEILTSYEVLSEAYAKQGKYQQAFESHRKYSFFKDSVLNETNNRAIDELAEKYESETKSNTIRVLELENQLQENLFQRQQAVGIFLIAILVIMVLLAHSLYQNNKGKKIAIERLEEQNIEIHLKNNEIKRQQEKIAKTNEQLDTKNKMLQDINNEKNHFIGIVVHDLRAPLNNIIGLVSLIKMEKEGLSDTQKELLDIILDSTKSLNNMIARILNIEAIESGDVKMDLGKRCLNELVRKVSSEFKKDATKKNIKITENLEDGSDKVWVDKNYTIQILTNLLSNAIKFSHANSQVEISTYKSKGEFGVVYKDEGPGLSPEDHPKLFGKFQRLSARPTGGESSTGLGLSIVKKYVDKMDGRIWCESEPGQGASFIVMFPTKAKT